MARVDDPEGREPEVLNRLIDVHGKNVIDIGCGDGRTTRNIAMTAASVLGVDPDEESVAGARAQGVAGGACRFEVGDALSFEVSAQRLDVVVFSLSL